MATVYMSNDVIPRSLATLFSSLPERTMGIKIPTLYSSIDNKLVVPSKINPKIFTSIYTSPVNTSIIYSSLPSRQIKLKTSTQQYGSLDNIAYVFSPVLDPPRLISNWVDNLFSPSNSYSPYSPVTSIIRSLFAIWVKANGEFKSAVGYVKANGVWKSITNITRLTL